VAVLFSKTRKKARFKAFFYAPLKPGPVASLRSQKAASASSVQKGAVLQMEALMKNFLSRFLSDESGMVAIEYGLIAISVVVAISTIVGTAHGDLAMTSSGADGGLN
jgi:pilus assembly protein Flp/PilA